MSTFSPSRRSVLLAPVAAAFAGAGASTPTVRGLSRPLGFVKPLRAYAIGGVYTPKPFELLHEELDLYSGIGRSLPNGLRLPQISDQGNGLIADGDLGEFIGFGLPDESYVGHGNDLRDKGVDSGAGLIRVVDQYVTDQRPQEQLDGCELNQKRVERHLRLIRHIHSSIGSIALSMLDRVRRFIKSVGREQGHHDL